MPPKAVPQGAATGNAPLRFRKGQFVKVVDTVDGAEKRRNTNFPKSISPGTTVEILEEEIFNQSGDSSMLDGTEVIQNDNIYLYRLQMDTGNTWFEAEGKAIIDKRVAKIPHKYLSSVPNGIPDSKFYAQGTKLFYTGPRNIPIKAAGETLWVKTGDVVIIAGPAETATSGNHTQLSPQNAFYPFQMTEKTVHKILWKSYNPVLASRLVPA